MSDPFDAFDDIFKKFEKTVKDIGSTIKQVTGEVSQKLETSRKNRVNHIKVYDDLGREAGSVHRTADGLWVWRGVPLSKTTPDAAHASGQTNKLREAVDAMMETLHGL